MSNYSYIYLIQDGEYLNTNTFKIGRTTQTEDTRSLKRFKTYTKNTIQKYLRQVNNDKVNDIEKEIINIFKEKYKLVKGNEWFSGDCDLMIIDIEIIINKYIEVKNIITQDIISNKKIDSNCLDCGNSRRSYWTDGIYGCCIECCCINCNNLYNNCICTTCKNCKEIYSIKYEHICYKCDKCNNFSKYEICRECYCNKCNIIKNISNCKICYICNICYVGIHECPICTKCNKKIPHDYEGICNCGICKICNTFNNLYIGNIICENCDDSYSFTLNNCKKCNKKDYLVHGYSCFECYNIKKNIT